MTNPGLARAARRTLGEVSFPSADEERELLRRAKAGDPAAADRLVRCHQPFVDKMVLGLRGYRVPFEDLQQEGAVGLVNAINGFDLDQTVRFSTYARWHVRARLMLAVYDGHSLVSRSSSSLHKGMFFRLRRERANFERKGLSDGVINLRLAKLFNVSLAIIESTTACLIQGDRSFDAPLSEGGQTFVDTIPDPRSLPDDADHLDRNRVRSQLTQALDTLDEREREIVVSRNFVEDEDELTLEDLAIRFGISKQRVQQIEKRALEKLRSVLARSGVEREMPAA